MSSDIDNIVEWQNTNDPDMFLKLMKRYKPVVSSVTNKYRTAGVSPATIKAQANTQLLKAFKSYDATKGTQPSTHIWNNLQKVKRVAAESLMSGHIPENRNLKKSMFTIAKSNLEDRIGYEPSVDDMADEMGWGKRETARMFKELSNETTASNAKFDFYGNSTQGKSKDRALVDYMYHELNGKEKVVFEHTFGYGGKKVLSNKNIAKKIKENEMYVHRSKKKMAAKIKEYR